MFQDCGIPSPDNAKVALSENKTMYGDIAVIRCNIGYRPDGSTPVSCSANGTWESWPSCNIIGTCFLYRVFLHLHKTIYNHLYHLCHVILLKNMP
jgi:hypothetical protein